jgi:hypothetical protein
MTARFACSDDPPLAAALRAQGLRRARGAQTEIHWCVVPPAYPEWRALGAHGAWVLHAPGLTAVLDPRRRPGTLARLGACAPPAPSRRMPAAPARLCAIPLLVAPGDPLRAWYAADARAPFGRRRAVLASLAALAAAIRLVAIAEGARAALSLDRCAALLSVSVDLAEAGPRAPIVDVRRIPDLRAPSVDPRLAVDALAALGVIDAIEPPRATRLVELPIPAASLPFPRRAELAAVRAAGARPSRPRLAPGAARAGIVDGAPALIERRTRLAYPLNETAAWLWHRLVERGEAIDRAAAELSSRFGVPRAVVEADVSDVVAQWSARGFAKPAGTRRERSAGVR